MEKKQPSKQAARKTVAVKEGENPPVPTKKVSKDNSETPKKPSVKLKGEIDNWKTIHHIIVDEEADPGIESKYSEDHLEAMSIGSKGIVLRNTMIINGEVSVTMLNIPNVSLKEVKGKPYFKIV